MQLMSDLASLAHRVMVLVVTRASHRRRLRSCACVDRQPAEVGRAVNDDVLVLTFDVVQLCLEPCLPVVLGGTKLHVGVRQKNVGRDDVEVGDARRVN